MLKAFRKKDRARRTLVKLLSQRAPPPRVEKARRERVEARSAFKKALKAEVKAMVGDVLQAAKEEGSGEWSKQAQAMVNRLTNNNKGEQEVADFGTMNYPEGQRKAATGAKAVGALQASSSTR